MIAQRRGFTLVELLVVIGIIAILAAIVVPQAAGYFRRANATAALADIQGIRLALVTIMQDSKRSSLKHLYDADQFHWAMGRDPEANPVTINSLPTMAELARAQEIYTRSIYALLREGRSVLSDSEVILSNGAQGVRQVTYRQIFNREVVKNLGTSYLADLGQDPWGEELYQIWPGPWPRGGFFPIMFRIYEREQDDLPGSRTTEQDILTLQVTDELEETYLAGFAAPYDLDFYIYSYGENQLSGQASRLGVDNQANDPLAYYEPQEEYLMAGGDDVNSWDKGQSWMRFYR